MGESDGKGKATVSVGVVAGNALFDKAVAALGLDQTAARWLFVSVLNAIGSTPEKMTADDLGNLLPEVDRRVRQLVQPAQADQAMAQLYRVLFDQAGPA